MESGGIMQRIRALIPIFIPLFVSSFRRAYELAIAMECRCYRGGEGRTRMKQLHMRASDAVCILTVLMLVATLFILNLVLTPVF
ncbi:MAG: energy-coupling factor transporter transmembrane component T, partial [Oscillospiraceae bacterium]|nr:energy-coupling factor transporter transmembrane component T [Oscillospiraceae bacterium]